MEIGIIKGVLKEELENSLRIKEAYERELSQLPQGSLIRKKIHRGYYYYVVLREKGRVKFIYKGKQCDSEVLQKYAQAKELRAKYRNLLSRVKKQIRFLKGVLRGKEPV